MGVSMLVSMCWFFSLGYLLLLKCIFRLVFFEVRLFSGMVICMISLIFGLVWWNSVRCGSRIWCEKVGVIVRCRCVVWLCVLVVLGIFCSVVRFWCIEGR